MRRLVLVALVLLAAAVAAAAPARAAGDCTADAAWATQQPALASDFLALVNAHRATLGLPALAETQTLDAAAAWKAANMAGLKYFAHDDPSRSWSDRIVACGYRGRGFGENIAYGYGSAAAVVDGWLGSVGHRANIENASYRATGIAAARAADGTLYWVQEFGISVDAQAPVATAPAAKPMPARRQRAHRGSRRVSDVVAAGNGSRRIHVAV